MTHNAAIVVDRKRRHKILCLLYFWPIFLAKKYKKVLHLWVKGVIISIKVVESGREW